MKYKQFLIILTVLFFSTISVDAQSDTDNGSSASFHLDAGVGVDSIDGLPENFTTHSSGSCLYMKARYFINDKIGIGINHFISDRGYDDDQGNEEYAMELDLTGTTYDLVLSLNNKRKFTPYLLFSHGNITMEGDITQSGLVVESFSEKDTISGYGFGVQGAGYEKGFYGSFEFRYYAFKDAEDLDLYQGLLSFGYKF